MRPVASSQHDFYQPIFDAFPALESALDATQVARELAQRAPSWYPSDVELHAVLGKVYVKPGKHVKLIYHFFSAGTSSGPAVNLWVAGRVRGKKKAAKDKEKAKKQEFCLWDDQLILKPFVDDKKLDGINELSDSDWALDYVRQHASAFGVSQADSIQSVAVEPFKYVPGKRILYRYRILGPSTELCSYVKLYQDDHGAWSADVQQKISTLLKTAGGPASVPGIYLYDPGRRIMFQEDWGGAGLESVPITTQPGAWQHILSATHQLHRLHVAGLEGSPLDEQECLKKTSKDVREISKFVPGIESALETAQERLSEVFAQAQPRHRMFLHGSLNPAQILVQGDRVGFVDFDGATLGDPLYDVSELLVGLFLMAWTGGAAWSSLERFRSAALEDYRSIYADQDCAERADGYFLMFLLNKIHQRLKELRPLPEDAITHLEELLQSYA